LQNKKIYKRIALVAALGFLYLFIQHINFVEVQNNLYQIGWQFGLVFVITGLAYAMAAIAWLLCFKEVPSQLSASKLFIYRQIGETLSTINPANIVVGESAKVYMLKQEGVAYEEGVASILLSRILIFLSLISLFLLLPIVLYQLEWTSDFSAMGFVSIALFSLLILTIFHAMVHPKLWLYQSINSFHKKWQLDFIKPILPKLKSINELLHQYYKEHQSKLLAAFLLSVLHWLMGAVEIFALLYFLDIKITLLGAILVEVGATCIKSIGAFIPGQVGVEEYGNKLMLNLVDINTGSIWVAVSILRRTRQVIWLLIGGLLFLVIYKKV